MLVWDTWLLWCLSKLVALAIITNGDTISFMQEQFINSLVYGTCNYWSQKSHNRSMIDIHGPDIKKKRLMYCDAVFLYYQRNILKAKSLLIAYMFIVLHCFFYNKPFNHYMCCWYFLLQLSLRIAPPPLLLKICGKWIMVCCCFKSAIVFDRPCRR